MGLWSVNINTVNVSRLQKRLLLFLLISIVIVVLVVDRLKVISSNSAHKNTDVKYNTARWKVKDPILEETVEFVPGRTRVLKTPHGTIQAIDILFTPMYQGRRNVRSMDFSGTNKKNKEAQVKMFDAFKNKRGFSERRKARPRPKPSRGLVVTDNSNLNTDEQLLSRTSTNCSTQLCTEKLSLLDRTHFDHCSQKANVSSYELNSPACHFMNGNGRYPVALASYPGSGNTWVRGLLQEVTGLCTGGVYCDVNLRQNGFPGEEIRSGVVLVVGTNQTDPQWSADKDTRPLNDTPLFESAILLVRNPFDAILDEWAKKNDNEREGWSDFVSTEMARWQQTLLSWLTAKPHQLLVVHYEELRQNTKKELKRMLDFLQVVPEESKLETVVERLSENQSNDSKYTSKQRDYARSVIRDTVDTLKELGLENECNLYLSAVYLIILSTATLGPLLAFVAPVFLFRSSLPYSCG